MMMVPNSYGLPTQAPAKRLMEGGGSAERVNLEGENRVRLESGSFSTCKPGDTDWYVKSPEMFLDYDRNEGKARDASLWFQDLPILYAPTFFFPLGNGRHTGFLSPYYSASTRSGRGRRSASRTRS